MSKKQQRALLLPRSGSSAGSSSASSGASSLHPARRWDVAMLLSLHLSALSMPAPSGCLEEEGAMATLSERKRLFHPRRCWTEPFQENRRVEECKIPFIYENHWYRSCTQDGSTVRGLWCPLKLKASGEIAEWRGNIEINWFYCNSCNGTRLKPIPKKDGRKIVLGSSDRDPKWNAKSGSKSGRFVLGPQRSAAKPKGGGQFDLQFQVPLAGAGAPAGEDQEKEEEEIVPDVPPPPFGEPDAGPNREEDPVDPGFKRKGKRKRLRVVLKVGFGKVIGKAAGTVQKEENPTGLFKLASTTNSASNM